MKLDMILTSLDAEAPAMERTQSSKGSLHSSLSITPKKRASNEKLLSGKKIKPEPEQKIKSEVDESRYFR